MKALMFPGQGSQFVGMGRDLFAAHASVRQTYEEASAVLGYDVGALSFNGPEERLASTDVTQPALLVCSVAVWRLLGCRDAGRVDLRCDAAGRPHFLEANPLPGMHPQHSDLPILSGYMGIAYVDLIDRIVRSARRRIKKHAAAQTAAV